MSLALLLALGCTREGAPAASTAPLTQRESASPTSGEPDTTGGDAPVEPTTAVAEQEPQEPPPSPEPAEEPPPPVPVDMTPAAAPTLCATLVSEPDTLRRSEFKRGGVTLPNDSRADVLECAYMDPTSGEVVTAFLVIRMAGEEYVTTEDLGQAYEVPGMTAAYRLGRIERVATGVRIRVTGTDTFHPDTGDPDSSGRAEVESSRVVVTCTLNAEYGSYDCERE